MPALRNAIPSIKLTVWLPEDLHSKCAVTLYSEAEGRIPKSAWKSFFSKILRDHFSLSTLDLAPYVGCPPGVFILRGTEASLDILKKALTK